MKTSIKIRKFFFTPLAADGGVGSAWTEIQTGQRLGTVSFQGSDADVTNHKNILGGVLESTRVKGDKTVAFQLADLTPDIVAAFTGGSSESSTEADTYIAPENESQAIEMSVQFLTDKNVLITLPRVSFDGYPAVMDDDLHYYQLNGVVLVPEKAGLESYRYDILKQPDNALITSFTLDEETGTATIDDTEHTVAIVAASGTDVTALTPVIDVSLGASITPRSGTEQDFTSAVEYVVTSANGEDTTWTVTVTVAAIAA
jgi:hypothetical protein